MAEKFPTDGNCSKPFCLARRRNDESLALCHSCATATDIVPLAKTLLVALLDPVGYSYREVQKLIINKKKE